MTGDRDLILEQESLFEILVRELVTLVAGFSHSGSTLSISKSHCEFAKLGDEYSSRQSKVASWTLFFKSLSSAS